MNRLFFSLHLKNALSQHFDPSRHLRDVVTKRKERMYGEAETNKQGYTSTEDGLFCINCKTRIPQKKHK